MLEMLPILLLAASTDVLMSLICKLNVLSVLCLKCVPYELPITLDIAVPRLDEIPPELVVPGYTALLWLFLALLYI